MLRVDFTSQNYLRNLATGVMKLRAAGPVVQVHFPIVGKTWITTTNDLAGRVLKDSETFTMRKNGRVAGLRWWMPGWLRTLAVSMLTMDEPDHTRLRSIVDEAFRRRAIIRHPVSPDDDAQSPQERDFDRWRTAIHIIQRLREAGIKCELNNGDQTRN